MITDKRQSFEIGLRVGHGYDVHKFIKDRPLIMGGIEIPYEYGLEAHSDGYIFIHAMCDAILGAAGLGDIGQHFPDTDVSIKGIRGSDMLATVIKLAKQQGYVVGNIDVTIIAQAPKLMPHIPAMREKLAKIMEIDAKAVNLKATTTEKMGYIGRKEGMAVHSVCLLSYSS